MDSDGYQYSSSEYVALSNVRPTINSTRLSGTAPALGMPVATVAPQFPPAMNVLPQPAGNMRAGYRAGFLRSKYTIPAYLQKEATNYEMYSSPGAVARSTQAMDMGNGYVSVSKT